MSVSTATSVLLLRNSFHSTACKVEVGLGLDLTGLRTSWLGRSKVMWESDILRLA